MSPLSGRRSVARPSGWTASHRLQVTFVSRGRAGGRCGRDAVCPESKMASNNNFAAVDEVSKEDGKGMTATFLREERR